MATHASGFLFRRSGCLSGSTGRLPALVPAAVGSVRRVPPLATQPADLLDAGELARVRLFALLAVVLPASVLFLLPFLGGDPHARNVFGGTLLGAMAASGWLFASLRHDERYDVSRLLLVGTFWLAAALAGLHYLGVFSPVVVVLPLGVLFFGLTRDVRAQGLGYLVASGAYVVLAVGAVHGGGEGSLGGGSPYSPAQAMVMVAIVEVVLAVTFVSTRAARAATVLALARNDRASRAVVQKDALLQELQQDLARALDVAGVGRFSETVVGNYKLGGVIGRGAMGEVYEATHVETHAEAAVKLLHTHTLREPGSVDRFLREAKMAAALETPHVVRIFEMGGFEGELPYLAMERLRGDDLADILRRATRLGTAELLRLLREVGLGLTAARRAGVVHRDVKPRNLFLSQGEKPGESTWKLLDFGVSKLATADVTHSEGIIVGTPEYMAPEQAAGQAVTYRTDMFALGAVAYRAMTGSPAFGGDHIAEVLYQVGHAMPQKPSAIADLPPEVDYVLAVALAKLPAERFDSADELAAALEAAARGEMTPELRARGLAVLKAHPWGEAPADDE
jgi:tRNA A-37 threonylcarbamoyl transferase component Bud32